MQLSPKTIRVSNVEKKAFEIVRQLRRRGKAVVHQWDGNLSKQLRRAEALGARASVLVGEDELQYVHARHILIAILMKSSVALIPFPTIAIPLRGFYLRRDCVVWKDFTTGTQEELPLKTFIHRIDETK